MKKILKTLYALISILFIFYLLLPTPDFPNPPSDALQSNEPGDTETELRKAYFTNYTREEVMLHYKEQFEKPLAYGIFIPSYRLNYPPEEAQTIIRDQTRSTFLEEIVHPFRESIYINGFKPTLEKDTIIIEDQIWLQKITVRYIPSNPHVRTLMILLTLGLAAVLFNEWELTIKEIFQKLKEK